MASNFWSEEEFIERGRSGELEMTKYGVKMSVIKAGVHCTLSSVQIANPKGFPLHMHRYHDEVLKILEGEGEVVLGDESRKLKKGDVIFVPRGTPHALRMSCRILSVYSPAFDTDNPDRIFLE